MKILKSRRKGLHISSESSLLLVYQITVIMSCMIGELPIIRGLLT